MITEPSIKVILVQAFGWILLISATVFGIWFFASVTQSSRHGDDD